MNESASGKLPGPVERRVSSVLQVAEAFRTTVPVDELSQLLTHDGPLGGAAMARWIEDHPSFGRVENGHAVPPGGSGPVPDAIRTLRGFAYRALASTLFHGTLGPVLALVRSAGVTGSAAYGEPEDGDDCDLLVVTRVGAVWTFLTFTYLALRLRRRRTSTFEPSHWCFNYVLDESTVASEFARPQGFLFAREALTTRPVVGEPYYRGLIGSARWLAIEAPRLFAGWERDGLPSVPPALPAPRFTRLLNAVVFPWMASYLHLVALWRNWRFHRAGQPERRFRVVARWNRMSFATVRYDELKAIYRPASVLAGEL